MIPPKDSTMLDFPAPLGPSSAVTSPAGISSDTSRTTLRPPRATVSPSSASTSRVALTPRTPVPEFGASRTRQRRRSLRRSCGDFLGPEVGAPDLIVAEHLGGRPRGNQPAEVEHGGHLAARGHEA